MSFVITEGLRNIGLSLNLDNIIGLLSEETDTTQVPLVNKLCETHQGHTRLVLVRPIC